MATENTVLVELEKDLFLQNEAMLEGGAIYANLVRSGISIAVRC